MSDLDLGQDMSSSMRDVAIVQDAIGWKHFTEGKIATAIRDIQELHLLTPPHPTQYRLVDETTH